MQLLQSYVRHHGIEAFTIDRGFSIMVFVELVLAILIVGSIVFYFACAWFTYQFFTTVRVVDSFSEEPVSILVPICGLDEGAFENWSSLCQQEYSCYEVLFGVVDFNDPAIPILNQLAQQYPTLIQVFVGLTPRGINHKDSTLTYLLNKAKYETIVFIDSDICVEPNYIRTIVAPLHHDVDVVTCAYVAHDPQHFSSALASLGRCCDFIPSALIARSLDQGLRFAIGVTIALRKSTLEGFGGLQLNRIGSDYNLGKRAAAAGYRVELSHLVLESDTGKETVKELFQRELRWARTIRFNRGPVYYTMIFCYGTVLCLPLLFVSGFATWAVPSELRSALIALSVTTYIIRYGQAAIAAISTSSPGLLRWFWALPLRDALSFAVWAIGAFGNQAIWRGRRLRIEGDGLIQQLD